LPHLQKGETSAQFIERLLKMVVEAKDSAAALAAFREIFDPDVKLIVNGDTYNLSWFESHVQLIPKKLRDANVKVTHAAREGNMLIDRHIVRAVDRETSKPWGLEAIAAYEFNDQGKIVTQTELTRVVEGEYDGW